MGWPGWEWVESNGGGAKLTGVLGSRRHEIKAERLAWPGSISISSGGGRLVMMARLICVYHIVTERQELMHSRGIPCRLDPQERS